MTDITKDRIEMTVEILSQFLDDGTFMIEDNAYVDNSSYIWCNLSNSCESCKFLLSSCHSLRNDINIQKMFPERTL